MILDFGKKKYICILETYLNMFKEKLTQAVIKINPYKQGRASKMSG